MQYKILEDYNFRKNSVVFRIGTDILNLIYKIVPDKTKYNLNTFLMSFLARNKELKNINFVKSKNKNPIVCITHDIDYSHAINRIWTFLELEKKYNIKSTVNILTNGNYRLNQNFLRNLSKYADIGLHGYTHDANFGYRSIKKISDELSKAKQYLNKRNVNVIGYRAPSLSMTKELMSILPKLGFKYDSSIPLISLFYDTTNIPLPLYIKKFGIWEFPLLIQDEYIFREKGMNNKEAMEFIKKYYKKVEECKGLFICNFHPSVTGNRTKFYEDFLRYIKNSSADILTLDELYRRCKNAYK